MFAEDWLDQTLIVRIRESIREGWVLSVKQSWLNWEKSGKAKITTDDIYHM